jgi:DNA-directed RNA polymerase subunit M/transcription elongation factor TFIIS
MSMGFSFRLEPSFHQEQKQEQKQEQEQTLELRQTHRLYQDIAIRIQIIAAIRPGEPSDPEGDCPKCGHKMSVEEILRGFLENEFDTTTKCPQCHHRFQPLLVSRSLASTVSVPFFCGMQTLGRLRDLSQCPFDELSREHQQIVASARFHFGTVTKAYQKLGITYVGEPALSWRDKVKPFLGQCSDALIAELCNVSPSTIRRYRVSLGVATYRSQTTIVN